LQHQTLIGKTVDNTTSAELLALFWLLMFSKEVPFGAFFYKTENRLNFVQHYFLKPLFYQ